MFREVNQCDLEALFEPVPEFDTEIHHYEQAACVRVHPNPLAVEHARINGAVVYTPIKEPIPWNYYSDMGTPPTKNQYPECEPEEWLSLPPKEFYPRYQSYAVPELCDPRTQDKCVDWPEQFTDSDEWSQLFTPAQMACLPDNLPGRDTGTESYEEL